MTSTYVRVIFWFAVIATLWNSGETCNPGSFSAIPDVCDQYNLCVKSGAATINILQTCPAGQKFDPNRGFCTATYDCLICD